VKLAVIKESQPGEDRVALVPEVAAKLGATGVEVVIEAGAGAAARFSDEDYSRAGATVAPDAASALSQAAVVARVQPPTLAEVAALPAAVSIISFLQPVASAEVVKALADKGATVYSLDLLPRISRAQSMDALSSQATVAGYRAGLAAAEHLAKFFPMFMTAAGTVPPAKVLVMGAGVAGLQAIATARRLGAVVRAYDVRAAAREEVQSLGAKFVELDLGIDLRAAGTGAGDHGDGRRDVRGCGHRRPGCGLRRQLRAVGGRRGRAPPRGDHRGNDQSAGLHAHPRQLPLRTQHRQFLRSAGKRGPVGP
jgi:H+-translocating NAD(P) transhydrogenase subunit alpha